MYPGFWWVTESLGTRLGRVSVSQDPNSLHPLMYKPDGCTWAKCCLVNRTLVMCTLTVSSLESLCTVRSLIVSYKKTTFTPLYHCTASHTPQPTKHTFHSGFFTIFASAFFLIFLLPLMTATFPTVLTGCLLKWTLFDILHESPLAAIGAH